MSGQNFDRRNQNMGNSGGGNNKFQVIVSAVIFFLKTLANVYFIFLNLRIMICLHEEMDSKETQVSTEIRIIQIALMVEILEEATLAE